MGWLLIFGIVISASYVLVVGICIEKKLRKKIAHFLLYPLNSPLLSLVIANKVESLQIMNGYKMEVLSRSARKALLANPPLSDRFVDFSWL